jgi:phosphoribosylformylglycinamidine synthase
VSSYTIEIHPKKPAFDPVARQVRAEMLEAGQTPAVSQVQTCRLFRIDGELTPDQVEKIAQTLLVDPVVETAVVEDPAAKKKVAAKKGITIDVWPKPGVTDPVAETIEKGMRDLGFRNMKATSAIRYEFPKIKESRVVTTLVKKNLANELIHDIRVR